VQDREYSEVTEIMSVLKYVTLNTSPRKYSYSQGPFSDSSPGSEILCINT